jgi:hypothetical protein
MRAVARAVAAMWLVAGCGGGASSSGTGGSGGAASGTGGAAGATGGGGSSGALPSCQIFYYLPNDPMNPDGGSFIDPHGGTCNTIVVPTAWTTAVTIAPVDGGAPAPAGGTVLDGDYDMISWQTVSGGASTRRRIRVFSSGTYIEWAVRQPDATSDGGVLSEAYDTTMSYGGHTATFVSTSCGGGLAIHSYGYTAAGDDLTFFDYQGEFDGSGTLLAVDGYHRSCTRP